MVPSCPGSTPLTVYYDFEGDFNDHPGAGLHADDLTLVTGGSLSSDVPTNARRSTLSYTFDNSYGLEIARTKAWSRDLGNAGDVLTVMFWVKADAGLQEWGENTQLFTTHYTPDGSSSAPPHFNVSRFGFRDPRMDFRMSTTANVNFGTSAVSNVLGNDTNAGENR